MGLKEALSAFDKLQSACRLLEDGEQHDIAAVTSQAMAMLTERFGVGVDHISEPTS
jgi:hypothetical protein